MLPDLPSSGVVGSPPPVASSVFAVNHSDKHGGAGDGAGQLSSCLSPSGGFVHWIYSDPHPSPPATIFLLGIRLARERIKLIRDATT